MLVTLFRVVIVFYCIVLLIGCGTNNQADYQRTPGTNRISGNAGANPNAKQISIWMPDVNILSNDGSASINTYHLRLWTVDPGCDKSNDISQIDSFQSKQKITAYVNVNCTYKGSLKLGYVGAANQSGNAVTYDSSIKTLLQLNCVSCHSPGGSRAKTDLSSQATVINLQDKIKVRVANGSMPPNKLLSAADKQLFAQWGGGGSQRAVSGPLTLEEIILEPASDIIFKITPDMMNQNVVIEFKI